MDQTDWLALRLQSLAEPDHPQLTATREKLTFATLTKTVPCTDVFRTPTNLVVPKQMGLIQGLSLQGNEENPFTFLTCLHRQPNALDLQGQGPLMLCLPLF